MAKVYLKKIKCHKQHFCQDENGNYCYFIDKECDDYYCVPYDIVYIEVKREN